MIPVLVVAKAGTELNSVFRCVFCFVFRFFVFGGPGGGFGGAGGGFLGSSKSSGKATTETIEEKATTRSTKTTTKTSPGLAPLPLTTLLLNAEVGACRPQRNIDTEKPKKAKQNQLKVQKAKTNTGTLMLTRGCLLSVS